MPTHGHAQFCGRTRREFIWEIGAGFGALGLTALLHDDPLLAADRPRVAAAAPVRYSNPLAPKPPMFPAKAKACIFLFMYGGPSHVDTFDYKPELFKYDNKPSRSKPSDGRGTVTPAASSALSSPLSPTANAAKWSPTCSPTSAPASMTSPSFTACTPNPPSMARDCS